MVGECYEYITLVVVATNVYKHVFNLYIDDMLKNVDVDRS